MHYEDSYIESTLWNRIGIVALTLMAAAFLFAVISPVVSSAGADDSVAGLREDGSGNLIASEDDDDDDDQGSDDTAGSDGTGQPSLGSNSGNTATGTTRGTGVSHSVSDSGDSASANTATGTTRGTGPSHSVSNSS
ncbi:MAG: hypothetical protein AABM42_11145 [Actinomycetota bacterium]